MRISLGFVLILAVLFCCGCEAVKPWQRGRLASPCMQLTPRLGDQYQAHVLSIREGAVGGEGEIGGGCGCN